MKFIIQTVKSVRFEKSSIISCKNVKFEVIKMAVTFPYRMHIANQLQILTAGLKISSPLFN